MANHIIHKQTFNLFVESEDEAHGVSEAVQQTFNDRVLSAMDEVFNRLSPDDKVYRFDRLEIDLGSIEPQNIEDELVEKITSLTEQLLSDKINASTFDADEKNGMKPIPVIQSVFEAFVDFLQTGLLPWWFSDRENKTPEVLFDVLPGQLNANNAQKLKIILEHQNALKRLNGQFSEIFTNQLIRAISILTPGKAFSLDDKKKNGKGYASLISILITEILSALKKVQVSEKGRKEVRIALLELMPGQDIAYKSMPVNRSNKNLTPELGNFIGESFRQMIIVLAKQGFDQKHISTLLANISEALPDKTYSGFWLQGHRNEFDKFEDILDKPSKKQTLAEKDEKEDIIVRNKTEKMAQDGIYIQNAGLVILWPFLKHYFTTLKLVGDDAFLSVKKKERAVLLLQHIVNGDAKFPEQQLALNKLLCGLPLHHPVANSLKLTKKDISETDKLILAAMDKWQAIGKISIQGFRSSFLIREGRLKITDTGFTLTISRNAYDLLIDRLPWSISLIKYKWMDKMIQVDW